MSNTPASIVPPALKVVQSVPASSTKVAEITSGQFAAVLAAAAGATGLTLDPAKVSRLGVVVGPNGKYALQFTSLD